MNCCNYNFIIMGIYLCVHDVCRVYASQVLSMTIQLLNSLHSTQGIIMCRYIYMSQPYFDSYYINGIITIKYATTPLFCNQISQICCHGSATTW